jgi:gamma-glutamyltranspeptidase/glutathione hydrolase
MTLRQLLAPAIKLARYGFPMYTTLYNQITFNADRLAKFPASAAIYLDATNTSLPCVPIGVTFQNKDLARLMERIAHDPTDFYRGKIARQIVAAQAAAKNPDTGKYGVMQMEDISGYRAVYREPLNGTYLDKRIVGFPMPSSGFTTIMNALNLIEGYELGSTNAPLSATSIQHLVDAQNLGFADRGLYAGDADFVDVPSAGMTDKAYARSRRRSLFTEMDCVASPAAAGVPPGAPSTFAPSPGEKEHGTTHFSVVDDERNAMAWTTTIEANFGSAVVVPGTGMLLNNELTDFESLGVDPLSGRPYANGPEGGKRLRRTALGEDNGTIGGKRPRSSMSPTLIFNVTPAAVQIDVDALGAYNNPSRRGRVAPEPIPQAAAEEVLYAALGSPGGSSIIGAVFNVIVNLVEYGLHPAAATDLPRVLGKNGPVLAEGEVAANLRTVGALEARGCEMGTAASTTSTYGTVQTVVVGADGMLYGVADNKRHLEATAKGLGRTELDVELL